MKQPWKWAAALLAALAVGFALGRGSLLLRGAWLSGESIPAGTLHPLVLEEITVPEGPSAGEESDLLDLNTATEAQLHTLPGIGEVLARRIVDYREMNGPFASVEELTAVEGIGNALLYRLRELVTVK